MTISRTFYPLQPDYLDQLNGLVTDLNTLSSTLGATWVGLQSHSVDVSGSSDVTLTTTQCSGLFIILYGTLTGNINVKVPAALGVYGIKNITSGAYTVTVKTPSGSGVLLAQGGGNMLFCDGTNVEEMVEPNPDAWTPGLTFGGGSTGMTYTTRYGRYRKTGGMVTVMGRIALSAKGSSTGVAALTGLPFAPFYGSVSGIFVPVAPRGGITTPSNKPMSIYLNSTTTAALYYSLFDGAAGTQLTETAFANNTELDFSFSYFTA